MTSEQIQQVEMKIARAIVEDAVAFGYQVIVYDEEELVLKASTDVAKIMSELAHTSQNDLWFRKDGEKPSMVRLIYGNSGWDVIADSSDNAQTRKILARAETIATEYEGR